MSNHELDTQVQALYDYVDEQAKNLSSQSVDPATHALNQAYAEALHENPMFLHDFKVRLSAYGDTKDQDRVDPANLGRRGFKALIGVAMAQLIEADATPVGQTLSSTLSRTDDDSFSVLANRTRIEDWRPLFSSITENIQLGARFFIYLGLPITSNVSERSKLLKAVAALHYDTEERPLRIAEFGCSLNHTLKRLHLEGTDPLFTYDPVRAMRRELTAPGKAHYHEDSTDTQKLNRLLRGSRLLLRESVGVDLLDFDNPMFSSWALSNSRYLGELQNTRLSQQLAALTHYQPDTIKMVVEDFTNMKPEDIGEPADIVYDGFAFYQLDSEAKETQAHATAQACATDNGLAVLHDFVELDESGTPQFYKADWPNWSCNVLVYNKQRPELGWQKYFSVKNGRTTEVVVEDAARQAPNADRYDLSR